MPSAPISVDRVFEKSCEHYYETVENDINPQTYKVHQHCRKCGQLDKYEGSMTAPVGNMYRPPRRVPQIRTVPVATRGAVTSGAQLGRRI